MKIINPEPNSDTPAEKLLVEFVNEDEHKLFASVAEAGWAKALRKLGTIRYDPALASELGTHSQIISVKSLRRVARHILPKPDEVMSEQRAVATGEIIAGLIEFEAQENARRKLS